MSDIKISHCPFSAKHCKFCGNLYCTDREYETPTVTIRTYNTTNVEQKELTAQEITEKLIDEQKISGKEAVILLNAINKPAEVRVEKEEKMEEIGEKISKVAVDNIREQFGVSNLEQAAEELKPKCMYYSIYGCDISPMKKCDSCERNPQAHWKEGFKAGAEWQKEQDELPLIIKWFNTIRQMAVNRKTSLGAIMKDSETLDEIAVYAKDAIGCLELKNK